MAAAPAAALDFPSHALIYSEDYEGETSYPLTPEVNLLGMSGFVGYDGQGVAGCCGEPELTGGVARALAVSGVAGFEAAGSLFPLPNHGAEDLGLRGAFAGLVIAGDGAAVASVVAEFGAFPVHVSAELEVARAGATDSASLLIIRSGFGAAASIALTSAEATALLGGAAFTLDLFVDRESEHAFASIEIAGSSPTNIDGALSPLGGIGLSAVSQRGILGDGLTTSVQVDFTEFELYSALQHSFNVDVGSFRGTPADAYGAAGLPGAWNTVGLGTTALVDIEGVAPGATVTVSASTAEGILGGSGDDAALLGDYAVECTPPTPHIWSLSFAGLEDGRYRVIVYAPARSFFQTGALDVNGIPLPNLSGSFTLTEGVSWARVVTSPTGGVIDVSGTVDNAFLCAGIAGVQLVALPPLKVSSSSPPTLALVVGLLAIAGAAATRRGTAAK